MNHLDDLRTARNRYASELANRTGPPEVRWDEYERFLLEQLQALDQLIARAEETGGDLAQAAPAWHIRRGYSPLETP